MKIIIYNHFPVPTIYIYREINIISIINIAVIIVITCNYIVQIYIKYKKTNHFSLSAIDVFFLKKKIL